jgi:5'(3')-deoxyribonucleotidase
MNRMFLDMDDVIADFTKKANFILGRPCEKREYDDDEWLLILENTRLYRDLELCQRADEIVAVCRTVSRKINYELFFLTAVPRRNDMPWAFSDKVNWAKRMYPDIPVWFGPYSIDKFRHCKGKDILIDDRESNINDWKNAGGIAILHYDVDNTINQIFNLLSEEKLSL